MRLCSNVKKVAVVTAVAALALSGCGSASGGGGSTTNDAALKDAPSWCGPEQIDLALLDGFGGNSWRAIVAETGKTEAEKCPSVTGFEYSDAQGDTQKAISDINSMTATGVDAMVVFPDAGKAVLPALRDAYEAGVVTVPYRADPGGEAGEDYDVWVGADFRSDGEQWGQWIKKNFPDGANILFVGGPAGSSQGAAEKKGLDSVLTEDKYEFIGEQPFEVTNWDPALTQQVLTAAISKHPKIDVIVSDFGPSLVGALPEFEKSGRSIPAVVASDGNVLGCFFEDNKKSNEDFELMTVETGIDNVRLAIQHAVALATGGEQPEETMFAASVFEDSVGDPGSVQCDPEMPGAVYFSAEMPVKEQAELIK